jgi:hypothetical protein
MPLGATPTNSSACRRRRVCERADKRKSDVIGERATRSESPNVWGVWSLTAWMDRIHSIEEQLKEAYR